MLVAFTLSPAAMALTISSCSSGFNSRFIDGQTEPLFERSSSRLIIAGPTWRIARAKSRTSQTPRSFSAKALTSFATRAESGVAVTRNDQRWVIDARGQGGRHIVESNELLSAFLELEATLL